MSHALVIDGDGHLLEPVRVWSEYLDARWRDRLYYRNDADFSALPDSHQQARAGQLRDPGTAQQTTERLVIDGQVIVLSAPGMQYSVGDSMTPHGLARERRANRRLEEAHPGGMSGVQRLRVHDAEGIDAAVLFPSMGLLFGSICDPGLALGACQAVNRFAADYCSAAPRELYSTAALPHQAPELAARELRRCVREHGFVAGFVLPNADKRTGRTLADPEFEVLWSTAVELDVPICIHGSANIDAPTAGASRFRSFMLVHAVAHPFEQMLAFGSLLEGRVFERHPRLRVGFMESNAGWAPFWLDRLDEHYEQLAWTFDPPLTTRPSDIFRAQCIVGCETEEPMIPYVQQRLGEESVMWASDFPHFDCELPGILTGLLERKDIAKSGLDAVLRRTASRFYRLDEAAIARAVARRRGGDPGRA
jgi:predicted TIM-barrel fold metal-dependent hydrolase